MQTAASEANTEPLSECERSRLLAKKMGGCGLLGLLACVALVGAVVAGLVALGSDGLSGEAAVLTAFFFVCGLGLVVFVVGNADSQFDADIAEGIKRIVTGRVVQMPTDSSEGGPPYRYLWVAVDDGPTRPLVFHVSQALHQSVHIDEAVRIAYVPNSKTIIQLRTATYEYSICDEGEADAKRPVRESGPEP